MEYYTPKEAGGLLGLNEDTICSRIKAGRIPAINANAGGIKARYRIDKVFIDSWIEKANNRKAVYSFDW